MEKRTVQQHTVHADADTVFARVSDHVGTPRWVPKAKSVVLLTEGTPKNGVPAVRRVTFRPFGWGTIEERITAYDADARTFSYTITAGMPGVRDHLGTFTVTPHTDGCTVEWAVWFDFNPWLWAPFAAPFLRTFSAAMSEGLATLAEQYSDQAGVKPTV